MADGRADLTLSAVDKTKAAFESVKANIAGVEGAVGKTIAKFGAIGAAVAAASVAFDKLSFRSVIDGADELNKLSQRTGVAVEQLSALSYAAKLADVSQDELADGLKRLNINIAAAARGEKEQVEAFKAMGIAVKDVAGNVRSADAVFADLADRFQSYSDGANKVALANAAGGKSFERLIPLLNGGSKGLAEARDELEKFGGVISSDLARKSEQFNDNMTRLNVATNALKVSLASGLIGRLVDLSEEMVKAAKNGDLLGYSLERLKKVFTGEASREFVFGKALEGEKMKEAQAEVVALTDRISVLQAKLASASPTTREGIGLEIKTLSDRVAKSRELIEANSARIAKAAAQVEEAFNLGNAPGIGATKKNAPALTGSNSQVSQYDQLIKRIQERAAVERAELQVGRELTDAEKFRVDMLQSLTEQISKLTPVEQKRLRVAIDGVATLIEQNDATKQQKKLAEEQAKLVQQQTQDLLRQNATLRQNNQALAEANEEMGLSVDALEQLQLARLQAALAIAEQDAAQTKLTATTAAETGAALQRVELLKEEIELRENGAAKAEAQSQDSIRGFKRAIDDYVREAGRIGEAMEGLTLDALHGLEDEMTRLVSGQKTNFRGLIDAVIADFLRLKLIKPLLAEIFGDSGGGIGSALAGLFGTVSSVASGSYNANYSNEGRNYMTPSSASGGMFSPSITVNVDSRADQAYVATATAQGVQEGNKQMLQLLRTRGVL